jgi:hypothetical protein
MGYSSQAGSVAFMTQATPDLFPATFDTASRAMKLRSGALAPNRELLTTDPEIGGGRDTVDAYLGAVSWSGDYEFYARLEVLTTLLKAGFGSAASTATTGVNTHTFTPLDSATLPFLAVQENIGGGLENRRGCQLASLRVGRQRLPDGNCGPHRSQAGRRCHCRPVAELR